MLESTTAFLPFTSAHTRPLTHTHQTIVRFDREAPSRLLPGAEDQGATRGVPAEHLPHPHPTLAGRLDDQRVSSALPHSVYVCVHVVFISTSLSANRSPTRTRAAIPSVQVTMAHHVAGLPTIQHRTVSGCFVPYQNGCVCFHPPADITVYSAGLILIHL